MMSKKNALSADQVKQRIRDIHGEYYDLSKVVFQTINDKIILCCPKHGDFTITPRAIFQQHQGCRRCGRHKQSTARRKDTSQFIADATAAHGDLYDYSQTVYTTSKAKVNIICKVHGLFSQSPDNHINKKQGCPVCGNSRKNGKGGYTHAYFLNNPTEQTKPGILYAAIITNGDEKSIKIGITSKTTQQRFDRGEYKKMNIEVLYERHMTLYEAFITEQDIIERLQPHRFFTNAQFSGHTECFRICDDVNSVISEVFINMPSTIR